jgi:hypothetical protein
MLLRAEFSADQIPNGTNVNITFEWRSQKATTVLLNFDASQFSITPASFALAATAGQKKTGVESVRITRIGTTKDCDVHFVQGASDEFDTIAVV